MKDRTSMYPGRVKLVPVPGMANTYTMSWADEPLQEGTPLNKATLLSDTVAAALRLSGDDTTVNDALGAVAENFSRVTAANRSPGGSDAGKTGDVWVDITDASELKYTLYICIGENEYGYFWAVLNRLTKTLKTKVFTTSTAWTVPDGIVGYVDVKVFGGGGSGGGNYYGGGGGGSGYFEEWSGKLTPGDTYAITIGKGGAASTTTAGNAGGSTSFGSLVSAAGGKGGSGYTGGAGGSSGGCGARGSRSTGASFGHGGDIDYSKLAIKNAPTAGRDTNGLAIDPLGKGNGSPGSSTPPSKATGDGSYGGAGGGGGYGGNGGNGRQVGGGGGGGFGSSGNGGDGATALANTGGAGGYAAGGGGSYAGYNGGAATGAGGSGICMVLYYAVEVA